MTRLHLPLLCFLFGSLANGEVWTLQPLPADPDVPIRVAEVALETPDGPVRGLLATVDLTDPRVEVVVTEPPGAPPPPPAEVPLVGVAAFAEEHGLAVAVNANYFGAIGGDADVLGLCVSDGEVVSPARSHRGVGDPVLVFVEDRRATATTEGEAAALLAFDAVAGIGASDTDPDRGGLLVLDGASRGGLARVAPLDRHPRTAAGVDATGAELTLVVIDGRQPGWSVGATLPELAALLVQWGVDDAINLDGGGSSVMVLAPGVAGEASRTSRPSEDRPVAASLGIRLHEPPSTEPSP